MNASSLLEAFDPSFLPTGFSAWRIKTSPSSPLNQRECDEDLFGGARLLSDPFSLLVTVCIPLCLCAILREAECEPFVERLPYRITTAGQGGGGSISVAELHGSLLLESIQPFFAKDPCVTLTVLKLLSVGVR